MSSIEDIFTYFTNFLNKEMTISIMNYTQLNLGIFTDKNQVTFSDTYLNFNLRKIF